MVAVEQARRAGAGSGSAAAMSVREGTQIELDSTDMLGTARFPIRFDPWYRAVSTGLFLPPARSVIEIDGDEVQVRMAWAFRARFPRSAVRASAPYERRPLSRGVHGFAGRWLVNGSGDGIVSLRLEPRQTAFVLGFPVRLRELLVSVEDPPGLVAALRSS